MVYETPGDGMADDDHMHYEQNDRVTEMRLGEESQLDTVLHNAGKTPI